MKEINGYNISEQEFKKVSKLAEDVYNIAVIVDYFVVNQPEIGHTGLFCNPKL